MTSDLAIPVLEIKKKSTISIMLPLLRLITSSLNGRGRGDGKNID